MENNQSNITEETKHNDNLETTYEQTQQKEKTFSQEEVSQMIKDRLARKKEIWITYERCNSRSWKTSQDE